MTEETDKSDSEAKDIHVYELSVAEVVGAAQTIVKAMDTLEMKPKYGIPAMALILAGQFDDKELFLANLETAWALSQEVRKLHADKLQEVLKAAEEESAAPEIIVPAHLANDDEPTPDA